MDRKNDLAGVLDLGGRLLAKGDIESYWTLMSHHDPYARLAGDVQAGRGALAAAANARLDRAFQQVNGRPMTPEERRDIQGKIADADLAFRKANFNETSDIRVTSQNTVDYHKDVFEKKELPPGTYTAEDIQKVGGGFWSLYAGAPTKDIADAPVSAYLEQKANDIKAAASDPIGYAKNITNAARVVKGATDDVTTDWERRFKEWGNDMARKHIPGYPLPKGSDTSNTPQDQYNRTLFPEPEQRLDLAPRKSEAEDPDQPRFAGTGFDGLWQEPERQPEPELPEPDLSMAGLGDDEDNPFAGFYHQGGEVSDGDPATDSEAVRAVVQEGEFVLAKATVEGIDAELIKALNDLARADPAKAKQLRRDLAAAVGDHAPYGEEKLRKMIAESRHYWDPDSPHREETFLRMARLYRQAFPEADAEGRSALAEGGLVVGKHWQRKSEEVPTELPEGAFVLSQEAVKAYGADLLDLLNAAGIVKDRFALTEVRKAIAHALGQRLKLREDELRRLMADPRYWKQVNADYIRRVTDEYRHTYADLR